MSFYCDLLDGECRNSFGSIGCLTCEYFLKFKKEIFENGC